MNPDHLQRDPSAATGALHLVRGTLAAPANRRLAITELANRRRIERAARAALDSVGWHASTTDVAAALAGAGLVVADVLVALQVVGDLRGRQDPIPTEEEIETMAKTKTDATMDAVRGLLREDPTLSSPELWERLRPRRGEMVSKASFASVASQVRKELGIDGRAMARKRINPFTGERGAPEPTEGPARAPASPPEPEVNDECPQRDPDCLAPDDDEWHSHEACEKSGPADDPEDAPPATSFEVIAPASVTGPLAEFRQTLVNQLEELEQEARVLRTGIALVDRYGS
ncbi:hypothetical protein [Gaopeijia maritima]|uniref:hypothetical protein n=1 Tax=Gaopeijia maritima TaxID=3119007 RepID=UPI003273C4BE